jgi:hypothetical protein
VGAPAILGVDIDLVRAASAAMKSDRDPADDRALCDLRDPLGEREEFILARRGAVVAWVPG